MQQCVFAQKLGIIILAHYQNAEKKKEKEEKKVSAMNLRFSIFPFI